VHHLSAILGVAGPTSFAPTGAGRCYQRGPTAYAVG